MPPPSPRQELEQLVLDQIQTFSQSAKMTDAAILEYHLRYYRIVTLYRETDRIARTEAEAKEALLDEILEGLVTLSTEKSSRNWPEPSEF
jgi:hypothetical protein